MKVREMLVLFVREERTEIKWKYFLLLRINVWGFIILMDYRVRALFTYVLPDSRNLAFNGVWESCQLRLGLSPGKCKLWVCINSG